MNPEEAKKVAKMREELMMKANLPKLMKDLAKNDPSLDSGIREIQPKPKE